MTSFIVDPQRAAEVRTISTALGEMLTRIQNAYASAGVALPERQYWTMGAPAADCEQLVIWFVQGYIGPPGDEAARPQRCDSPRSISVDIQILRCVPTVGARGRAPTSEQIQNGSEMQAIDAWLLLDIADQLDMWDTAVNPGPGLGVIATIDVGEPQGGFQGVTMHLTTGV